MDWDIDRFVAAIAEVESHNNPGSSFGDGGRAMGRWQVHPDWVWGWCDYSGLKPKINEGWDAFIGRVLVYFAQHCIDIMLTPNQAAGYFHLGHVPVGGEDDEYITRFADYYYPIGSRKDG